MRWRVGGGAQGVSLVITVSSESSETAQNRPETSESETRNTTADQGEHHSSTSIEIAHELFKSPLGHRTSVRSARLEYWAVDHINPAGSGCLEWLHCFGDWPYMRLNSRLN